MFPLKIFKVSGHSMEPLIQNGNLVLILSYFFKTPKISDIVAVRQEDKILIKRIKKIINNKYYLEGDNKKDSLDSKDFGLISRNKILGIVIYKI